jgi:hypothetical protein
MISGIGTGRGPAQSEKTEVRSKVGRALRQNEVPPAHFVQQARGSRRS